MNSRALLPPAPAAAKVPTVVRSAAHSDRAHWRALSRAHLVLSGLLCCGVISDWAEPSRVALMVAVIVAGQGTFGLLLHREGDGAEHRSWAFEQIVFGIFAMILCSLLIPATRVAASGIFFLLIAFMVGILTPRQIGLASVLAVVMAGFTLAWAWLEAPAHIHLGLEMLNLMMPACYLPLLSVICTLVRKVQLKAVRQTAELAEALAQLEALAERDALTGAASRRHIEALLQAELGRQARTSRPFSVAMIDLDRFKQVNDGHGHAVGDHVLQTLVRLAGQTLRPIDILARWGGEEFIVLLPDSTSADAGAALERLRQVVAGHDWSRCSPGLVVTFSCGICEHRPGDELRETEQRADAALYAVKQTTRNRVAEHVHAG